MNFSRLTKISYKVNEILDKTHYYVSNILYILIFINVLKLTFHYAKILLHYK